MYALIVCYISTRIWTSSLPLAMFTDSDSDSDSASDSGLDERPFDVDSDLDESAGPSSVPHLRHTDRCRQFLEVSGDISDRVLKVLALMDDLHLNLPLFLWAISWNVPELISNNRVRYARTTLMVSVELPGILAHWHKPPRSHSQGIRTRAAGDALNSWAMETVCETLDRELSILKPTMSLPQKDLSEEVLLSVSWKEMIPEVKSKAPTLWKLFRHTMYTPRQEQRNQSKDPDAVQFSIVPKSLSPSNSLC